MNTVQNQSCRTFSESRSSLKPSSSPLSQYCIGSQPVRGAWDFPKERRSPMLLPFVVRFVWILSIRWGRNLVPRDRSVQARGLRASRYMTYLLALVKGTRVSESRWDFKNWACVVVWWIIFGHVTLFRCVSAHDGIRTSCEKHSEKSTDIDYAGEE